MKNFLKLFPYIDATFTCWHRSKSCYQQHLSDYQVTCVSQRQTSKQKSPRVCYVCLQCIGFGTGLHSPSSACAASHRANTCCTHWPATCLAQPVGPAQAQYVGVDAYCSSHTPFSFNWAGRTRQFASMLPTSFHPKKCCLSGYLDKDNCPLNIRGGALYKGHPSFCFFP